MPFGVDGLTTYQPQSPEQADNSTAIQVMKKSLVEKSLVISAAESVAKIPDTVRFQVLQRTW